MSPNDQNITFNSNVTFTCEVYSLTMPSIMWSTNATYSISSQPNVTRSNNAYISTLILTQVTYDNIGTYTCNATNEGGNNITSASLGVYGKY